MCDWTWCESLGFQSDCTSLLPEVQLTLIWFAPPLIPHRSPLPCRIELWIVTWQSLSGGVGSSSHKMLGTKRFMRRCPNRWGGGCSHFCLIILGWQLTRFGQFKLSCDDCLKGGCVYPFGECWNLHACPLDGGGLHVCCEPLVHYYTWPWCF